MDINKYASDLTKREGKNESLSVAQIKEVLKLINADLWGIPYFLIRLKRPAKKAAAAAVILFALGMTGCATFPSLPALPKAPEKKLEHQESKKITREPVWEKVKFRDPASGAIVEAEVLRGMKETEEYSLGVNAEETKGKASIWSRIMALGWVWAALMIAGLFFPPIALIMGVVNRGLGRGVNKMVVGVETALNKIEKNMAPKVPIDPTKTYTGAEVLALFPSGAEVKKMVLNELSRVYDDPTKALVKKIREEKSFTAGDGA